MSRELVSQPSQKRFLLRRSDSDNVKLAVFVHGFLSTALSPWGLLPLLLSRRADEDEALRTWDFVFIGYEWWLVPSYLAIANRISTEWLMASSGKQPYGRNYSKLALVGHSLGTLGIRQFLCSTTLHTQDMHASVSAVLLFGSPLFGSKWARVDWVTPIGKSLRPGNVPLLMLRRWSQSTFQLKPWPPPVSVKGQSDAVVGGAAAEFLDWENEKTYHAVLGHGDLVKASAWDDSVVIDCLRSELT